MEGDQRPGKIFLTGIRSEAGKYFRNRLKIECGGNISETDKRSKAGGNILETD